MHANGPSGAARWRWPTLPYFDELLRERPFLAGERYSMADISLFAGLAFAAAAGLPMAPELTGLAAWRMRMEALPAVRNRTGQTLRPEDITRLMPAKSAAS